MNWIGAIGFVALAALAGEEFGHYNNPASGPGLVQSAMNMMTTRGAITASVAAPANSEADSFKQIAKSTTPITAATAPHVDYDKLANDMNAMSPYKDDPNADKKADKVSMCIENIARKKLSIPLVSLDETAEQTSARKKKTGLTEKLNMAKAAIDAPSEEVNGCRHFLTD